MLALYSTNLYVLLKKLDLIVLSGEIMGTGDFEFIRDSFLKWKKKKPFWLSGKYLIAMCEKINS